jgi:hypothetical protein
MTYLDKEQKKILEHIVEHKGICLAPTFTCVDSKKKKLCMFRVSDGKGKRTGTGCRLVKEKATSRSGKIKMAKKLLKLLELKYLWKD